MIAQSLLGVVEKTKDTRIMEGNEHDSVRATADSEDDGDESVVDRVEQLSPKKETRLSFSHVTPFSRPATVALLWRFGKNKLHGALLFVPLPV